MRADSAAAVLAACLPLGLCDANNPAPRCAVNCASNIRDENGAIDLKIICGDKLMTNSLFQCLIGSCPQDAYGPAVAHVVLACSGLGMSIGPLHPVEIQHMNLPEKPQYLPTPSIPPAYGTPSDASQPDTDHLTLAFDISIDLKCNSGSDGLVTVSLPPLAPSIPAPSTAPSSPVSDPGTDDGANEGESQGEGEDDNDDGDGEGSNAAPSSPDKQTAPAAASSCSSDSTPSNTQGSGDGKAPPQSADPSEHGGPAVTSAPSASPGGGNPSSPGGGNPSSPGGGNPSSPGGGNPSSPASTSQCSTASQDTGGLGSQGPNQSEPSNGSSGESSHPSNDGDGPKAPATSSVASPAPVSSNPTPASSPCSATGGADMSVDPIPGSHISNTAEPATTAQTSPPPSTPSPASVTSLTEPAPASTIHTVPQTSSKEAANPSSGSPPEYARSDSDGSSPGNGPSDGQPASKDSATETSRPGSSAEPLPQESHSPGAQAPSYGQGIFTSLTLTGQTGPSAAESAGNQPTGKTAEPSETTLWPTGKTNRTTGTTRPGGHNQPSTTSCESSGKETVAARPTADGDAQQDESFGSVMVKIIRPGEAGAETMLMTVWDSVPSATAAPSDAISNVAQLAIGSSVMVESMAGSGHDVEPSSFPTQSRFVVSRPTTTGLSVPSDAAETETSLPQVALVSSGAKPIPRLCMITLFIILVSGILMS
ncbi:hypothetical protein V8C35DRAFT_276711 [Trichoderma chlorosporum]